MLFNLNSLFDDFDTSEKSVLVVSLRRTFSFLHKVGRQNEYFAPWRFSPPSALQFLRQCARLWLKNFPDTFSAC